MPWQAHWALVIGELIQDEETGLWLPAYPEAFHTMMRQQGKTLIDFCIELDRAILWESFDGKPQAIAHSGQSGSEARKKFRKEHWPLLKRSPLHQAVRKPRFSAEDTGIDFKNDSILTLVSNSEDAGHGGVFDLGVLDELWADIDDRREQALTPAQSTRHDYQTILSSTAGTEKSVQYLRKQTAGRAAVTSGRTEGIAYLEYAFDRKDDPEDPKVWRENMPALGYTITERTVRRALETMLDEEKPDPLSGFKRAFGNLTERTGGDRVIPAELWALIVEDEKAAPSGKMILAADGLADHSSASIAVAGGNFVSELLEHRAGVSWLLERTVELATRHRAPVVVDASGPVGQLIPQLEARSVKVISYGAREVMYACAEIYSRIADGPEKIRVRPTFCDHCETVPVTAAVESVSQRITGEGWRWSRATHDPTPLMAVTFAVGAQAGIGAKTLKPMFATT